MIILGGTNDLKKYEENSSFDFYDVLSIFNALVKLHNVSHTFGARSVAVSIPEVECEISETCPNFKKARNKINEPLQSLSPVTRGIWFQPTSQTRSCIVPAIRIFGVAQYISYLRCSGQD